MINYIWILGISILTLLACNGNTSTSKSSPVKMDKAPLTVSNKAIAPNANNVKQNLTGDALQAEISSITGKTGEEACVSFAVSSFNGIIGLQHSINFNPKQLKFKGTQNYGLPHLNKANFGSTKSDQGTINFLWFDMDVKGLTVPDNKTIFDLCFDILAKKGVKCEIAITDKPIKIEVIGPNKTKMKLKATPGYITVN